MKRIFRISTIIQILSFIGFIIVFIVVNSYKHEWFGNDLSTSEKYEEHLYISRLGKYFYIPLIIFSVISYLTYPKKTKVQ